jgi:hypothetical protein
MKRCSRIPPALNAAPRPPSGQATEAASRRTESISSTMKFWTMPSLR